MAHEIGGRPDSPRVKGSGLVFGTAPRRRRRDDDDDRPAVLLRGDHASIAWGYHTAAVLRAWRATRRDADGRTRWTLSAGIDRADSFQLRQTNPPLLFVAKRKGKFGQFCFPVVSVTVGRDHLTATLGPPEF